ncbi:MAG: hypothetical protein R3228_06840 [Halioglobus sp.]|nr:hypothetical protein [Halioglobus sp.]
MELRRRGFLASAGTVSAAGLLLPTGLLANNLPAPESLLRQDDFRARIGEWLLAFSEDAVNQSDLTIVRVTDLGSTSELEQFTVLLRSHPGALAMPSALYNIAGEPTTLYLKHSFEFWTVQFYVAEFSLLN